MLTIHGVSRSRASRIIWLCHELGLPFRQEPVIQAYKLPFPDAPDAPVNTRSPSFLALSPAGAIPVIEDDGLVLSESLACTLYLAKKHGGDLAPRDAAEEALMLQWSFYAATAIEPDALTIMMLHTGREQSGEDAALIERDVFGALPIWREPDMHRALRRAQALARPGDRVLLSPACASFDQFKSYVDRGEQFRAAVRELA